MRAGAFGIVVLGFLGISEAFERRLSRRALEGRVTRDENIEQRGLADALEGLLGDITNEQHARANAATNGRTITDTITITATSESSFGIGTETTAVSTNAASSTTIGHGSEISAEAATSKVQTTVNSAAGAAAGDPQNAGLTTIVNSLNGTPQTFTFTLDGASAADSAGPTSAAAVGNNGTTSSQMSATQAAAGTAGDGLTTIVNSLNGTPETFTFTLASNSGTAGVTASSTAAQVVSSTPAAVSQSGSAGGTSTGTSLTTIVNSLNGVPQTFTFTLASTSIASALAISTTAASAGLSNITSAAASVATTADELASALSEISVLSSDLASIAAAADTAKNSVGTTATSLPAIASSAASLPASVATGTGAINSAGACDCSCVCEAGLFSMSSGIVVATTSQQSNFLPKASSVIASSAYSVTVSSSLITISAAPQTSLSTTSAVATSILVATSSSIADTNVAATASSQFTSQAASATDSSSINLGGLSSIVISDTARATATPDSSPGGGTAAAAGDGLTNIIILGNLAAKPTAT